MSMKARWLFAAGACLVLAVAAWLLFEPLQSLFQSITIYAAEQQRGFSRRLGDGVMALKQNQAGAAMGLIGLGFAYGVFHAIGPGHGKAVISAYALSHNIPARRTVGLAFASAIVQGLSAIAVVGVLSVLLDGGVRRFATSADDVLEIVSYGAVGLIGLYLMVRGLRALRASAHHHHDHESHDHDEACGCGHAHMPSPDQVAKADSLKNAAAVAIAVGIRPCSGAILVLVLAFAFGFVFSGIASVMAMSAGTALTVSAIALGSQSLRWPLMRAADVLGVGGARFGAVVMVLGGLAIVLLGVTLISGALQRPAHPFF